MTTSEPVLGVGIDRETDELSNDRRVGETRLPRRRDFILIGGWVERAKSVAELCLAVEGVDLDRMVRSRPT